MVLLHAVEFSLSLVFHGMNVLSLFIHSTINGYWRCFLYLTRANSAACLLVNMLPRWLSGKETACQCRRCQFDPWVWKIPLEEEMTTHSSILAGKIPWTEEPGGLQFMGSQRIRHNWATEHSSSFSYYAHCSPPCFFHLMYSADVHTGLHGILMYSFHSLYNHFPADGVRLISYLLL